MQKQSQPTFFRIYFFRYGGMFFSVRIYSREGIPEKFLKEDWYSGGKDRNFLRHRCRKKSYFYHVFWFDIRRNLRFGIG